ncbi:hypothetical protein Tco_1220389 [Tanacetum coccineum]
MTGDAPPQISELTSDHSRPIQVEDLTNLEENQHVLEIEGHQSALFQEGTARPSDEQQVLRPPPSRPSQDNRGKGSSGGSRVQAISIGKEQFVQWISDYKLPNDIVMLKNVRTYKGLGDPDSHVWTFKGAIKNCAWNDPITCHMLQ